MTYSHWPSRVPKPSVVAKDSLCLSCLLIKKKNNHERFWTVCASCIELSYGKKYVRGIFWFSGTLIFFWTAVCR